MTASTTRSSTTTAIAKSTRKVGGVSANKPAPVALSPASPAHGDFVWNGGPVITYPQIYATFWGVHWSDATHQAQAARLVQFLKDLPASNWMNIMSQYGAGNGAGSGLYVESSYLGSVASSISDTDIHNILQKRDQLR